MKIQEQQRLQELVKKEQTGVELPEHEQEELEELQVEFQEYNEWLETGFVQFARNERVDIERIKEIDLLLQRRGDLALQHDEPTGELYNSVFGAITCDLDVHNYKDFVTLLNATINMESLQ